MSDELRHYGTPRHSGRYPWGSGKDPYQSAIGFMGIVDDLRRQGLSEVEIARGLGITTSQLRARKSLAGAEIRAADRARALELKSRGLSNMAIGREMGKNESSIRALLDDALAERASITAATSNMLKESVAKYKYVDVGAGVENHVGVSRQRLNTAISELTEQGYKIHYVKVEQLGIPGQFTSVKVLGSPDSTYSEVFRNKDLIQPITGRSENLGRTYSDLGLRPIQSVNSKEVMVRYGEEGKAKDGVIELRRGVEELDLGNARYAQVRIGVDNTHYMKGMAVYSDDMPDGINIIYNSNKAPTGNKLDAMKKMKPDPDNPFGSNIKRILDPETGERISVQRGALNVVNEEGDWQKWSTTISSQILSKQTHALAKKQLDLAYQLKKEEFNDIMTLTNPTVKKQLLDSFADDCDASAVHLKAAMLPRQANKIILPVPGLKEGEVYAPSFNNGENVVLIRHPHGGTFEIPELVVNNKSLEARKVLGTDPIDAIGIHPKAAQKLSGADFDGDTVIVIPNNSGAIKTQASLKGLKDFDHIEMYKAYEGMPKIKPQTKQTKMGEISNLITDMTIQGATTDELARAVRHSMVVIDAEKHNLNYKQSYIDNGISALAQKYQGSSRGGASTLISRASSEVRVSERKGTYTADPETGERVFIPSGGPAITPALMKEHGIPEGTPRNEAVAALRQKGVIPSPVTSSLKREHGISETATYDEAVKELRKKGVLPAEETYIQRSISPSLAKEHGIPTSVSYTQAVNELRKQGVSEEVIARGTNEKTVTRTTKSTKMAEAQDAYTLLSGPNKEGTNIERVYADYANSLKALANTARKEAITTKSIPYSPSANKTYAQEVASLTAQLNVAQKNAPRERQAQIIANAIVTKKVQSNPPMDRDDLKKIRTQALAEARSRSGAKKDQINITPKEWEAIQAGAVSNSMLQDILNNTNLDVVKQYATPRTTTLAMSDAKIARAQSMLASGYTQSEVAKILDVSISTLTNALYK